jgi:hypothetical protein
LFRFNFAVASFSYTGAIVSWTVPTTAVWLITARGAQGGSHASGNGGLGAYMQGSFSLSQGQVLSILVGQQPPINAFRYPGGGGGTVNLLYPSVVDFVFFK